MTPEQVIALKFSTDFCSLGISIVRYILTRQQSKNRYGIASNLFLLVACLTNTMGTALTVLVMKQERKSLKKFNGDVAKADLELILAGKAFFFAHLSYYTALCSLKGAYLAFYAQIFIRTQVRHWFAWTTGCVLWAVAFIIAFLLNLFWCRPIEMNWSMNALTDPHCPVLLRYNLFAAMAVINVITDLIIFAIPMLVLRSLNLRRNEKWGLFGVFCIGGISILASLLRFGLIGQRLRDNNFSWSTMHLYVVLSHLEVFFGIIAFALPTFRVYFRKMVNKITGASTTAGNTYESREQPLGSKSGGGMQRQTEIELFDNRNDSTKGLRIMTGRTETYISGGYQLQE